MAADLAIALERIRSLEELAKYHREQLAQAEARYHDLKQSLDITLRMLPAPKEKSWWKLW
ncbi:MAG: hypothetical protein J4F46_09305 [Dehalococcoidia bacterium]|nr:hypothetical protein [Dehalococcoidia bacterium]